MVHVAITHGSSLNKMKNKINQHMSNMLMTTYKRSDPIQPQENLKPHQCLRISNGYTNIALKKNNIWCKKQLTISSTNQPCWSGSLLNKRTVCVLKIQTTRFPALEARLRSLFLSLLSYGPYLAATPAPFTYLKLFNSVSHIPPTFTANSSEHTVMYKQCRACGSPVVTNLFLIARMATHYSDGKKTPQRFSHNKDWITYRSQRRVFKWTPTGARVPLHEEGMLQILNGDKKGKGAQGQELNGHGVKFTQCRVCLCVKDDRLAHELNESDRVIKSISTR